MEIKTFIGLAECVDEWVNDFIQAVDVIDIQTHATGNDTMMATVIYRKGAGERWKITKLLPKRK